jgi:hypothetical protein
MSSETSDTRRSANGLRRALGQLQEASSEFAGLVAVFGVLSIVGSFNDHDPYQGALAWLGMALLAVAVALCGEPLYERIISIKNILGILMIVFGFGLITLTIPQIVRYIVRDSSPLANSLAIESGVGDAMIAAGWIVRASEASESKWHRTGGLLLIVGIFIIATLLPEILQNRGWMPDADA